LRRERSREGRTGPSIELAVSLCPDPARKQLLERTLRILDFRSGSATSSERDLELEAALEGKRRIAYLVGGADTVDEAAGLRSRVRSLLERAHEELTEQGPSLKPDLILSGGTDNGVPGIAAELGRKWGIPVHGWLPGGATPAPAVVPHFTKGRDFSIRDQLDMWEDLLSSGTNPEEITVLATKGGLIADAELSLSAALGAKVAYLSVNNAFPRCHLNTKRLQLALPEDSLTLRAYLVRSWDPPPGKNDPDYEAEIFRRALAAHKAYLDTNSGTRGSHDEAMRTWKALDTQRRESNLDQAVFHYWYLKEVGIDPEGDPKTVANDFRELLKTESRDKEILSELEHGRWVTEKVMAGFKKGARSYSESTHSDIECWTDMEFRVQSYDRSAIAAIPDLWHDEV